MANLQRARIKNGLLIRPVDLSANVWPQSGGIHAANAFLLHSVRGFVV
jgi:hypothetical protein